MSGERIVVVGAGLAGMACAFDLRRAGREVVVLEASDCAGGVVGTRAQDGFLFEEGPNSIQASAEAFRRLCGDLGIADRIVATRGEESTRWLWFRGRLVALPSSVLAGVTTPLLSLRAKLRVLTEPLRRFDPPPAGAPEPSFAEFLTERLGHEPTRVLAGAFVRGIYAAELDELGAASAFPRMWKLACDHHGLIRGAIARRNRKQPTLPGPNVSSTALLSFAGGLQELADALAQSLGDSLRTRSAVERVVRTSSGFAVVLADGSRLDAQHIVSAVPAPIAAKMLASMQGGDIDWGILRRIKHASLVVVHLGFGPEFQLPHGFGYLVPPDEKDRGIPAPLASGTIFASNLFEGRAPRGGSTIASFYRSNDVSHLENDDLIERACADLALAIGASRTLRPTTSYIRRWNDVIPRYEPGHAQRMQSLLHAIDRNHPGLELAGSFTGGVSVDYVIARGRAVARKILGAAVEGTPSA